MATPGDEALMDLALSVESMWLFLNAVVVLWMQVGFAMLEVGSVRVFYVQNILIKNVVDGAITIAMYFIVGFAFASNSGSPFIGTEFFFLRDADTKPQEMGLFLLAVAFASSAVTIVSGALAERCKLISYFIFSAIMAGFVYPVASHWVWSDKGWLSAYNPDKTFDGVIGYLDYAGSSIVHGMGGAAALLGIVLLGPRHGRFGIDGDVCELQGSVGNSGVYRVLGALLLFVSFLSFNASSVQVWQRIPLVGLIGSNTGIAAAFGCFTVMVWKLLVRNFQVHIMHCIDGLLAGCVAITASAGLVHPWAAAVIGSVGGVFYVQTSEMMLKYKLDDVVNAVAIHLSPGIWGVVAIGLFARPDNIQRAYSVTPEEWEAGGFEGGIIHGGRGKLLGVQVLGGVVIIAWVALTIGPTFYLLKYFNLFRVPTEVQISVHSGFKSAENYSWQRYANPKIISLGQSNGEVQRRPATQPPATQGAAQPNGWGHEGSHRASRLVADRV